LKKDSAPKVLIHEDFVPRNINHDREINDFMTTEAKEVDSEIKKINILECFSKG
jgi:hypothetical protein